MDSLSPKIIEMCQRSCARAFRLCDELNEEYGIPCDPIDVSDKEIKDKKIVDLSIIQGPMIEIRWGIAVEQGLSAFLNIDWVLDSDINEDVNRLIKQTIEVDLMDKMEVFNSELGPANNR